LGYCDDKRGQKLVPKVWKFVNKNATSLVFGIEEVASLAIAFAKHQLYEPVLFITEEVSIVINGML
jgi:hypothetical protein